MIWGIFSFLWAQNSWSWEQNHPHHGCENFGARPMAIGDRIEASTYLMALVGEGDVFIRGINPVFLESVISLLIDAGPI